MATTARRRPVRPLALLLLAIIGLYALIVANDWTPKLGLDLRGGTSVILTPERDGGNVSDGTLDKAVDIIRQRVNGTGVSEAEVVREGDNIVVSLPDVGVEGALKLVGSTARLSFRPVINGPIAGDPNAVPSTTPTPTATGTPSPTGSPRPSATATTAPPRISSPTATANSRAVPPHLLPQASPSTATARPSTPAPPRTPVPTGSATPSAPPTSPGQPDPALIELFGTVDCTDRAEMARLQELDDPTKSIVACTSNGEAKYLLGPAELLGDSLASADATIQQDGLGGWVIEFTTTDAGAKKLQEVTTRYLQQPLAIVLDGILQSAPTIEAAISDRGVITGDFDEREAKDLANVLKYGALPVDFDPSELLNISPTLGDESLDAGILAGLLGLGLVIAYVLAYYRGLGLVTVLGLFVFAALNYALVVILGNAEDVSFTLTMAGIAGLIISVGISADSYVVFYERIKDEVKEGRTLRLAVDRAYSSAFRTIIAADTVSFLAAAALYLLSVGAVRGFAFTLGMATLLDVLMSYCFARPMVVLLARTRLLQRSSALGLRRPKEA